MLLFQEEKFTTWVAVLDDKNVVWLSLDNKESPVNNFNEVVFNELREILNALKEKIKPSGLVIKSNNEKGFSGGIDINLFKDLNSNDKAYELTKKGQAIFNQISLLECPTIALIHGFCVGGGLELALTCDYRIAVDDSSTKMGLTEVKLGIHPGWGGTVRLPRLINLYSAFDLILTGKLILADKAKKIGLVDEVVPKRHVIKAIEYYLTKKPPLQKAPFINKILHLDFIRPFIGKMISKKLAKKLKKEHYPAQYAVIDNWVEHNIYSNQAFNEEAKSIGNFLVSEKVKNLVRVFFLKNKLTKNAKLYDYKPEHIHVVGAGVMGGDIAAICASKGYRVTLQDKSLHAISNSFKRAENLFKKDLVNDHLITQAKDRLMPDMDGLGVYIADIIIEAIDENVKAKQELFEEIEINAKKDTILATVSSAIPLSEISKNMKSKKRLLRMHFFNPATKVPLVEVSYDKAIDEKIKNNSIAFIGSLNKLYLEVKNTPLVFRVLCPYIAEGIRMYSEGIKPHLIDKAANDFGMFLGPIELADTIGLDVCKKAFVNLGYEMPIIVNELIEKKELGKKTKKGFYEYKHGRAIKPDVDESSDLPYDAEDRLISIMLNEAVACLREEVVEDSDLLDAGLVFGLGFAPFLGGPMNYLEGVNGASIKQKLLKLAKKYGERFEPDSGFALYN